MFLEELGILKLCLISELDLMRNVSPEIDDDDDDSIYFNAYYV